MPTRAQECRIGGTEVFRFRFVRDPDGVLYLDRVEILVIFSAGLPQQRADSSCSAIAQFLIPTSVDPETAAFVGTCAVEPLVRGHPHDAPLSIWARVPADPSLPSLPQDIHCWELARYLGAPRGFASVNVPCLLN